MKGRFALKAYDVAVVGLAAALTVCSAVFVYGKGGADAQVIVQGSGRSWIFPPDAEERVVVAGPLGETVVEIRGGEARVVSSPCDNQICVVEGPVHAGGEWVACLPNGVFVLIEGRSHEDGEIDGSVW
ncbi:hypothetical protein FACS1894130_04570 [Spirochaetia bacterium]|nr:hypothetical protein FACS1894130_04570 [Spirochaetia bacterium]